MDQNSSKFMLLELILTMLTVQVLGADESSRFDVDQFIFRWGVGVFT